jgi:hypothetical protein
MVNDIRNRRMPRIGEGGGIWSFIHIDDATRLTFAALTRGVPGIYNIVDDILLRYRSGRLPWPKRLVPSRHAGSQRGSLAFLAMPLSS